MEATMNAEVVSYRILYNSRNITSDVSDHLLSLSYTDKVSGESDEIELQLEDADLRWQNAWFPEKGATVQAEIITTAGTLLCGIFTVDEIEVTGGRDGDVVTIRGVAAAVTQKLRTKLNTAHESKTLGEIVRTIAAKHGLSVQGTIEHIIIERTTQHQKSDLNFLKHLAKKFGYVFSIRGRILTFQKKTELEKRPASLSLDKADLISYSIKDKTIQTYVAATVKYHNPQDKSLKTHTATPEELARKQGEVIGSLLPDIGSAGTDSLEIVGKAENDQQAEAMADAALYEQNTKQKEGNVTTEGNILLVAGNNVQLTGIGNFSGKYHIQESSHVITRDGYTTTCQVKRVEPVPEALRVPQKKEKYYAIRKDPNNPLGFVLTDDRVIEYDPNNPLGFTLVN